MNILVIEDDKVINEGITEFLNSTEHNAIGAFSGERGLEELNNNKTDLVLLDIMLPGISGIEVLEKVKKDNEIPVIMLTAIDDELTQLNTFDRLCDDYITKPFSLLLLKKRIDAVLRRYYGNRKIWSYGEAKVDFESFKATYKGEYADVTPKEMQLLSLLVENEGCVLTRSQMLDKIWDNSDEEPFERVIDVYIKNLRKKLNLDCIYTVKGVGYKLDLNGDRV